MALSALPAWPLILFGLLEPAALVWGYYIALTTPEEYYAAQVPDSTILSKALSPQSLSLTLQMGNVLLLLAFVAVICCWTKDRTVARNYLIAVALADFGHIYASYRAMGDKLFWDVGQWNDMAWGNIGVSAFLNINRWAAVLGLFGKIGSKVSSNNTKQK